MRTTTESVSDVASRVDKVPAQSFSCTETSQKHSAGLLFDPNCSCGVCLAKCDAEAAAGRIPTNRSWWKVQRVFFVGDLGQEVAR